MANLLHRLLRSRQAASETEAETETPVTETGRAEPAPPDADPTRFEARPKPGRRGRKTSEEVSSIGPGEP